MAWFQLRVTETVGATAFGLRLEVLDARGVPPELFVARVADDAYDHPASPLELRVLAADRDAAVASGDDFYRVRAAVLAFATRALAKAAEDALLGRLQVATRAHARDDLPFGGAALVTFDTEAP